MTSICGIHLGHFEEQEYLQIRAPYHPLYGIYLPTFNIIQTIKTQANVLVGTIWHTCMVWDRNENKMCLQKSNVSPKIQLQEARLFAFQYIFFPAEVVELLRFSCKVFFATPFQDGRLVSLPMFVLYIRVPKR